MDTIHPAHLLINILYQQSEILKISHHNGIITAERDGFNRRQGNVDLRKLSVYSLPSS